MGAGKRARGRTGAALAIGESSGGAEEEVTTERTQTEGMTEEVTGNEKEKEAATERGNREAEGNGRGCLLYTSDAADE